MWWLRANLNPDELQLVDPDIKVYTKLHDIVQKVLQLFFRELISSAQPKQCECEIQNKYLFT